MKQSKLPLRQSIRLHLRALKMLHRVSPRFFPITALYCLFSALMPYVTVFFSARILRELATARRPDALWLWVALGVAATGLCAMLEAVLKQRKDTLFDDLYGRKEILFIEKAFSMDYADLDDQRTHDLRAQIAQNEKWSSWGLIRTVTVFVNLVKNGIGLISGIALTVSLFTARVPGSGGALTALNHPAFIAATAAVMVGVSLLAGRLSARVTEYWSSCSEEATLGNRLFGHFGFIGDQDSSHEDIRMYDQQRLVSFYLSKNSAFGVHGAIGRLARGAMGILSGLGEASVMLVTGFVYVFTCLKALGGAFDVGSVTQYIGAATALFANLYELTQYTGVLRTNSAYLEKTFAFFDIPNSMYQGSLTTEKRADRQYDVEFQNVSFRYPGSEIWALKNVSIRFRVGSRLAIVGENGSGKTTFIKLLCRLYDPQEGQILLNGIDIRKYNYRDYMNLFSVVFQDFQLLSQPLGDNVAGRCDYDPARVEKALTDAGFDARLETMPDGLHTQLYRDFGENGVKLSGGEAQKIAIARALYKDAPFIILDEPTAALDPIAEAEIYGKFNDIVTDKTAIYISHRLSSCKFCDEITVFDKGRIIQQGAHEALLADAEGKYAALWHAQAQYYTTSASDQ